MDEVETRYVKSDTGWIAYQVVGSGPVDVLVVRPSMFPIDLMWDEPALVRFLDGLSSFSCHVWFDARGTGASDPIDEAEGRLVESIVDDMVAVLDELGCEKVVVLGPYGPAALLFAATHPERTKALVLVNPYARLSRADDYPEGFPDDFVDEVLSLSRAVGHGMGSAALGAQHARRRSLRSLGGARRALESEAGRRGLAATEHL